MSTISKTLFIVAVLNAVNGPAEAFYDQTNVTEVFGILPNHSAFWIPGAGDTKNGQTETESEDFLKANKVAGKFFQIPHAKLSGSVYMGWDYYVPTGRLIVVDRTPFFHEWTKAGRGTEGGTDQSFPCHSLDNIEVTAEVSIATEVREEDAARFLYYFGVNPPGGDPHDPKIIFTSVFEGKSLNQVMSGWGRGEIQSRVCRELNRHKVEDIGTNGNQILEAIEKEAKPFYLAHGISIEYIGWAGGFSFPPTVKNAIEQKWAADHIQASIPVLMQSAEINAVNGWDRHLPGSVTILGGALDWLASQMTKVAPSDGKMNP